MALATLSLPFDGPDANWEAHPDADPTWRLLSWLSLTVGPPFVALAATAPLLQSWYARAAGDPYFLYGASNAGSLAALTMYPFWIERHFPLSAQSRLWSLGFRALPVMMLACALCTRRFWSGQDTALPASKPTFATRAGWTVLAAVPSSYMLGVTAYLTTDLAAVPLLWVVPLGLYLVTFIIAFGRFGTWALRLASRILPFLVMIQAPVMIAGFSQPWWIPLHLATFFNAALVCHGELAARRPPVAGLTGFYLTVAFGGIVGSAFNAVVAPYLFDRLVEYPLVIIASCLILSVTGGRSFAAIRRRQDFALPAVIGTIAAILCANVGGVVDTALGVIGTMAVCGLSTLVAFRHRTRPARFAWTIGALLAASGLITGVNGRVLARSRNFFGVLTVTEDVTQHARRLLSWQHASRPAKS